MLSKLREAGDIIKPVVTDLCHYVDQKTFNDAIVSLGLLSEDDVTDDDVDMLVESEGSSSSDISTVRCYLKLLVISYNFCTFTMIEYITTV